MSLIVSTLLNIVSPTNIPASLIYSIQLIMHLSSSLSGSVWIDLKPKTPTSIPYKLFYQPVSFLRIYRLNKLFFVEGEIQPQLCKWLRGDVLEWRTSADWNCSEVRSILTHFVLAPCEAQEVLCSELPKFRHHCLHSFQITCIWAPNFCLERACKPCDGLS